MTSFDVLIIGGGVAGMQCALVLGSAKNKPFAKSKKTGIIMHQKASHLQNALFNNVLGISPKTLGKDILLDGKLQLSRLYPEVLQIEHEKVLEIITNKESYTIVTTKSRYLATAIVLALNYSKPFTIKGLENFLVPHKRANPTKDRIELKNRNYKIRKNLYCCGTIAGIRSQFAIAAGSGASVATDILTEWNNHIPTKIHDKIGTH